MKKIYFYCEIAAMAMTACTSEDVVTPPAAGDNGNQVAMQFNVNSKNLGRGDNDLDKEYYDFGVWAYKAEAEAGIADAGALVMQSYLVGYDNGTVGYVANNNQEKYSTNWYYEGLGWNEKWFDWNGSDIQADANVSFMKNQYLKYWDMTANLRTYFYAAAPYTAFASKDAFNPATRKLTFKPMEMSIDPTDLKDEQAKTNYMFASVNYLNTDKKADKYVDLGFQRLGAKIRLGFYETIPGYHVEIEGYSEDYPNIYCLPAKKNGTGYSAGEYTYKGTPSVTFNNNVPTVTWDGYDRTSNAIISPVWFTNTTTADPYLVSNDSNHPTLTGWKGVVPANADKANDGFTLNISFKIIADDTDEVIYVRGARVFVPAVDPDNDTEYTQWKPNTAYTYIFKITTKVPGQPNDPDQPVVDPSDPYLIPIVFKNMTVTPYEEEEWEFDLK